MLRGLRRWLLHYAIILFHTDAVRQALRLHILNCVALTFGGK